MNALLSLGKWLFALPLAVFGVNHFMYAGPMSGMIPAYLPGGIFWVYLTGACLVAAAVSMLIGKMDKLAATLLGIFMLILVALMHLPGCMDPLTRMSSMPMLLKDLMIAGASFMYAQHLATDRSVIG